MNITYIISSVFISVLFFIYKYSQVYDPAKKNQIDMKFLLKDTIVVFILAISTNYLVDEYFYKDFYNKIFPSDKQKIPTQVFTDQPGF